MRTWVVVPTYNERASLPELVSRAQSLDDVGLLVVDDSSPDGTGEIADELAEQYRPKLLVVHRSGVRGYGRACREGLRRALATDATVIGQMDADLSHDPQYLPEMIRRAADCDVVIGSRYLNGVSVVNWPLYRLALSTAANQYIRMVTRMPVHDSTSGFRCWRRQALERIPLGEMRSDGYAFLVETLYEAYRVDCTVSEVPIVFTERRHGSSKLGKRVFIESLLTPWRLRLRAALRRGTRASTYSRTQGESS